MAFVGFLCLLACGILTQGAVTVIESSHGLLETTLRVEVNTVFLNFKNISFQTRTYNGRFPGPLLRAHPGDRVRVLLSNQLDPNTPRVGCSGPDSSFRAANSTNLHIHGIYAGLAEDNTAVCINPGQDLQYEYKLDDRTGTSTLFYHPHLDGSSAMQLAGGMAGAFEIVDPSQERTWFKVNGLDVFVDTEVLVLQYLDFNPASSDFFGDLMNLGNTSNLKLELSNPTNFQGQLLLVNGEVSPIMHLKAGHWSRLKLINAFSAGSGLANFGFADSSNETCDLKVLAYDGVYLKAPRAQTSVMIPQGGRADIAVMCIVPGKYSIVSKDASVDPIGRFGNMMTSNLTLVRFDVSKLSSTAVPLPQTLPGPPTYYSDLLGVSQVDGRNSIMLSNFAGDNIVNGWPYNGSVSYSMSLDSLQEWHLLGGEDVGLTSLHPYHQHVSHFQVMETSLDTQGPVAMVGDYRDTLPLYKALNYTVRFRPAFPGILMIHCHILKHEDLGMMTLANVTMDSVPRKNAKTKFLAP